MARSAGFEAEAERCGGTHGVAPVRVASGTAEEARGGGPGIPSDAVATVDPVLAWLDDSAALRKSAGGVA